MKDQTKDDGIVMMQDEAQNQLTRKKKQVRDTKVVPNNFQEWFYNDTNKHDFSLGETRFFGESEQHRKLVMRKFKI